MVYLVANENGDWWTVDSESETGNILWVIPEDKLKENLIRNGELEPDEDFYTHDKIENYIWNYGNAQDLFLLG